MVALRSALFRSGALVALLAAGVTGPVYHGRTASGPAVQGIGPKDDPTRQTPENWVDDRWQKADIGRFLSTAIELPSEKVVKSITIKVGEKEEASICFDTELLRYAAGWTGGFLQFSPQRYGLIDAPKARGVVQFKFRAEPAWAYDGNFADPRSGHLGNLPRTWAHYKGLFLNSNQVVLSYSVGQSEVLDSPGLEHGPGITVFTRSLEISPSTTLQQLRLCESPAGTARQMDGVSILVSGDATDITAVAALGHGVLLTNGPSGCAEIRVAPHGTSIQAKAFIWKGPKSNLSGFVAVVKSSARPALLEPVTRGGPARWTQKVTTRGSIGFGPGPLVIDTLIVPHENPWNALMFTSGHDFFENGDAAICTAHGDVWRVSGIDSNLQNLSWKRFATGLYQPLGLKILRNQVYVLGRDQISILRDLNNDGEADFYENFNSDCLSTGSGHSYATCLETDPTGNFYFLKCGENTPHGGTLLRVSADGQKLDVVATGFRNANGMGISPTGLITAADQQGEWVPETRVDVIHQGGFYGYMPMHKRSSPPKTYDGPLCWIARTIDNSAGGEVWVPENTWGPLAAQMIHLSYGRCTMMLMLRDESSQVPQGAVAPLPGRFLSGVMRGRFRSLDGQLYLSGLRGWQTAAVRDGCFQRVRYTGAPFYLPIGYSVKSNRVSLTFSQPLEHSAAENVESYALERWNYHWTSSYGSADYSVTDPDKTGRDTVIVQSARVSDNGHILDLQIADLRPAMQMRIQYNLKAADGKPLRGELYATINTVPR